ncbi:MAG: Sua5/YciO/YrdC/YwlC family protein, partial [Vicinamibacterales bacterium]
MTSASVALDSIRIRRCTIAIEGIVQGVGFRPFVYRTAVRLGLAGSIRNSLQGALVDVEGEERAIRQFIEELSAPAATAARPPRLTIDWDEPRGIGRGFTIAATAREGASELFPVPDLAVCEDCLAELEDPRARRRGYPLLTCTACGPRFTIVRALPFDRERTTMAGFTLCARCREDYEDAGDRRFHAEAIACPECGPRLALYRPDGAVIDTEDPIGIVADALRGGRVVAIKGVGGYHLACDATAGAAVDELRRRKRRDGKPLALMVADVEAARALGHVSGAEARLLTSAARPIVLVSRRAGSPIADAVAPGCRELGIMLPYTPLHRLLLRAVGVPVVMTSGNTSDEVIAHHDDDALSRLQGVADLFLTHDRPIEVPCDDSVARVVRDTPRLVRRSRGYVPLAIRLP